MRFRSSIASRCRLAGHRPQVALRERPGSCAPRASPAARRCSSGASSRLKVAGSETMPPASRSPPRDSAGSSPRARGARSGGRRSRRRATWISPQAAAGDALDLAVQLDERHLPGRRRACGRACDLPAPRRPISAMRRRARRRLAGVAEQRRQRGPRAPQLGVAAAAQQLADQQPLGRARRSRRRPARRASSRAPARPGAAPGSRRCRRRISRLARWRSETPAPARAACASGRGAAQRAHALAERGQERVLGRRRCGPRRKVQGLPFGFAPSRCDATAL